MRLPAPRGHTSAALTALLRSEPVDRPALVVSTGTRPVWADDDLQLSLWICYRGFDGAHPGWDGHPALAQFRAALEVRWETALRALGAVDAPAVRTSTDAQFSEWELHRSFWRPRRTYRSAMRDLDFYGSVLFSDALPGVDEMPAPTLALANAVSLLGSHRRLVDALIGFLTAAETLAGDPYAQLAMSPGEDVLFGFGVCHSLHALLCAHVMEAWSAGRSSLRGRWLPLPGRINVGC
ncbi:hypothetical protein Lesp02_67940 [Lentzea sp. NBRC 105346]|uniref:hypothetical protein n=1 Tax=Lentzea sp. NBRC 105346 TaxID=3032205 RepID=UPI0024A05651|nr:hypothetical protein [Lentzea sp. NBRC 105346]GLZ34607.1 hypothetical protein Lesp02_67940 [Lentzea sp. NBRC 105346]